MLSPSISFPVRFCVFIFSIWHLISQVSFGCHARTPWLSQSDSGAQCWCHCHWCFRLVAAGLMHYPRLVFIYLDVFSMLYLPSYFQGNPMLIFHCGSTVAKSTTHWSNPRVCLEIACTYVRYHHHIIHYSKLFRVRTCCLDKQHVIIVVSMRALIETWKMAE